MKKLFAFLALVFFLSVFFPGTGISVSPVEAQEQESESQGGWSNIVVAWDWQSVPTGGAYYYRKVLLAGTTEREIVGGAESLEVFALVLERTNPEEKDPAKFNWRINPEFSVIGDDTGRAFVLTGVDPTKGWKFSEPLRFDVGNSKEPWLIAPIIDGDPTSAFEDPIIMTGPDISHLTMERPDQSYSKDSYDDMSTLDEQDFSKLINFVDIHKLFTVKEGGQDIDMFTKDCGGVFLGTSTGISNADPVGIRTSCAMVNENDSYLKILLETAHSRLRLDNGGREGFVTLDSQDLSISATTKEYFQKATHQGTASCTLREVVEHTCASTPYQPKDIVDLHDYITDTTITPEEAAGFGSGIENFRENLPGYNIVIKGPEVQKIQGLIDRLEKLEDTRTLNDIPPSQIDSVLGNNGFSAAEIAYIREAAPNSNNLQTMFEALKSRLGIGAAENVIQARTNLIMMFLELIALLSLGGGGLLWITAVGNEERIKKGKKIVIHATIGLAGATIAHVVITIVIQMFTNF